MEFALIISGMIIAFLIIFLIINRVKSLSIRKAIKQKTKYVDDLYKEISILSEEKAKLTDRVEYLEDIKGDAFQVKLRTIINEVKIDFTKIEVVTMLAGISILLERTKNPDDAKIYLALIDKINGFIKDMKEESEVKE